MQQTSRRLATILLALVLVPAARGTTVGTPVLADKILVLKALRRLQLLHEGKILREYTIALGRVPTGAKQFAGDGRTPEGRYRIDSRNPASKYHLALHVSYPSPAEQQAARARGRSAGGMIMIHGLPDRYAHLGALHRLHDWTEGCIAVTNDEIEEIWRLVPDNIPIEIRA